MSEAATNLKRWATEELGHCGTVSVEDLSKICVGSMNNVWSWIVSHCRERERVRKIHGNLILMKKKVEGKKFFSLSRSKALFTVLCELMFADGYSQQGVVVVSFLMTGPFSPLLVPMRSAPLLCPRLKEIF